jgi:hypothetical protein
MEEVYIPLMMEEASTFETSVNFYQITRRNIPPPCEPKISPIPFSYFGLIFLDPLKPDGNCMSHLLQQSILYLWDLYDSHCKQQLFP